MLIDADLSQIEWRGAAFLSRDEVMCRELNEGRDAHSANCVELMELPLTKENRQDTKIFNFRMIFADPSIAPYAYYRDPRMPDFPLAKWEQIVQNFLTKYAGLAEWHNQLYRTVCETGKLIGPLGQTWQFNKHQKRDGSLEYNKSQIFNYPVQGTAGAIIKLAAVIIQKKLKDIAHECHLVMLVHDSLVFDAKAKHVDRISKTCLDTFREIPTLVNKFFNYHINVPIMGEVKYGPNWASMTEWKEGN